MPEPSSQPALNVACRRAMVLRVYQVSSAVPCAFMATFRHPTNTPSATMTSRATG
jgi:hypothetical protein